MRILDWALGEAMSTKLFRSMRGNWSKYASIIPCNIINFEFATPDNSGQDDVVVEIWISQTNHPTFLNNCHYLVS